MPKAGFLKIWLFYAYAMYVHVQVYLPKLILISVIATFSVSNGPEKVHIE